MNFAAVGGVTPVGLRPPCATLPPQRQLFPTTGRESTYRKQNAVHTKPATSVYKDTIFPAKTHHIEFCTQIHDFAVGMSVVSRSDSCPHHNCTDDECSG
jgi:hypothetical protein